MSQNILEYLKMSYISLCTRPHLKMLKMPQKVLKSLKIHQRFAQEGYTHGADEAP